MFVIIANRASGKLERIVDTIMTFALERCERKGDLRPVEPLLSLTTPDGISRKVSNFEQTDAFGLPIFRTMAVP
jgi:hypothetical protein